MAADELKFFQKIVLKYDMTADTESKLTQLIDKYTGKTAVVNSYMKKPYTEDRGDSSPTLKSRNHDTAQMSSSRSMKDVADSDQVQSRIVANAREKMLKSRERAKDALNTIGTSLKDKLAAQMKKQGTRPAS